ncbi:MaoC family dehydratase [Salinisphaera hydrothermalis]|uniref:Enoyl-CoA hydratase 1-like protein n=1 Tax=Salinisphaera hydrothermalis (strain C41B8) TaxID=1304275 RepID=A0A084ILQ6_SALHC|nr:MaoC family dehydratase [Salinisphaera hydrothermalis]KEZ77640.1 enoyl-CoA hydratase 1-like protein [Salinisphaera hydrothermalis C41B8]
MQARVGSELGTSDWLRIDQSRIDQFAEATDDRQWIHVDVARATRESPFGGPVAHGFLTLSLIPRLAGDVFTVRGTTARVNYGLNAVRFVSPVPAGARIRARTWLDDVAARGEGRYRVTCHVTLEIEDHDKPACIAETLTLYII